MRHHFHRCMNLRTVTVPASELHGARRSGSVILEELCEARKLTPCVGLAECDVLAVGQKLELLVERATRMREEEGGRLELRGLAPERVAELSGLRDDLSEERDGIVQENLRLEAEIAGALDRELDARSGQEGDLKSAGLSIELESSQADLRAERLDEIDRALEAMDDAAYGRCVRCGGEIELERLRAVATTLVCTSCARRALAPRPVGARGAQPGAAAPREPRTAGPPPAPATRPRS